MKNKFFRILTALLASSLISSSFTVYAEELDTSEVPSEITEDATEGLSTDENGVVSGIYYEEDDDSSASGLEPAGTSAEDALSAQEGDGLEGEIIDVMNIGSSEENNCQVTINADLPENFDANIYVQLKNYDTGAIYQYTLYAVNNFVQRGYIPEGEYRVIECSVYDDINNSFPFNTVEDFTLKYGEVKTITVSLQDEQAAAELIADRLNEETEASAEDVSEYTVSDFDVAFTGEGTGQMAVTGAQSAAMTIVAKITKAGMPGSATVDISLDDGLTWNLTNVEIPYSGMINLNGTGLTLVFEVSKKSVSGELTYGSFEVGDTFRCVIHDPTTGVNYGGEHKGNTKLQLVDEDPDASIYNQMIYYNIPLVQIDVIKGGSLGEAVIRYTLDGEKFSDEMIVPESGTWAIDGTTLSINLYATLGYVNLNTGDSYTAEPYKETQKNLYGLIIFLGILFSTAAAFVWFYFKKQMVSQSVYTIHPYTPVRKNQTAPKKVVSEKKKKRKK